MNAITRLPALTLYDPWASLCVSGAKTLETRKGPVLSGYRGPLVIHRGKAPADREYLGVMGWPAPERPPWARANWTEYDVELSVGGAAIGVVLVEETRRALDWWARTEAERSAVMERARYHDLAGRYLSELSCGTWFPEPVRARGMQGRWMIEVPTVYLPDWAGGAR